MKQITVVGRDRPGVLAELAELLLAEGLDIRDVESQIVGEDLFLKLVLSDYDRGLAVLAAAGYQAIPRENVLLRIEDEPGALARLARRLADAGIDIRGISLVHQSGQHCAVAISSSDDARVREIFNHLLIS